MHRRALLVLSLLLLVGCGLSSVSTSTSTTDSSTVASQASPAGSPTAIASPSPRQSPTPRPTPSPLSANAWTMYDGYEQAYVIPWAQPPGFGSASMKMPTLTVSAFGQTFTPQIDTGSRGLRITQNLIPNVVVQGTPGSIFYWSSGIRLEGIWTTTDVLFPDATSIGGAPLPARASVPVLVQQATVCEPGNWPNACGSPGLRVPTTGPNDPKDVFMGIGFDRTGNGDVPEDDTHNQNYNPLLNLDPMRQGSMVSGYVLTPQGIQVGLTSTSPPSGTGPFAYTKLVPTGLAQVPNSPPDWQVALGNIVLDGQPQPPGEGVIDTGIADFLLTLPGQPTTGTLSKGTVQVNLLGMPSLVGYSFDASQPASTNPLAPSSVAWSANQGGSFSEGALQPFLNTGRNPLNGFNVLYDATHGYLGLQTNNATTGTTAFSWPTLSLQGTAAFDGRFTTDLPVYLAADTTLSVTGDATFNGTVSGSANLTITGGGTLHLGRGAYSGGKVTVTPGTRLVADTPPTTSIAVPMVAYDKQVGTGAKNAIYTSVAGGTPVLTEIDTGSNAFVVEKSYAGKYTATSTPITLVYDHCTNPRTGALGYAPVSVLGANSAVLTTTVGPMPIVVVPDGVVSNQGSANHAIMGMRMNGAIGAATPAGVNPLLSLKEFLPSPYNEMFVIDRPNGHLLLGRFNPADYGMVPLEAVDCPAQPAGYPVMPCWDDGAVPVAYTVSGAPEIPFFTNTLLDSGASPNFQFAGVPAPSWMHVKGGVLQNSVFATVSTTNGPMQIPLGPSIAVVPDTACNGTIVNAGNFYFNSYQVIYDQIGGRIGFRPSALTAP